MATVSVKGLTSHAGSESNQITITCSNKFLDFAWLVRCTQDRCPRSVEFAKAVRNQMVPQMCATMRWDGQPSKYTFRLMSKHGVSPGAATLHEWQTKHVPRRSYQLPLWRTGGDHQDALVLRGWKLSSRTWNSKTSPWMKIDWALIEQGLTSPPTQYRLYGRRFLQVTRPNQQYQSTEGTHRVHN